MRLALCQTFLLLAAVREASSQRKIPKVVTDIIGEISRGLKELLPPELNPDYTAPPPPNLRRLTTPSQLIWGGGSIPVTASPALADQGSHIFGRRSFDYKNLWEGRRALIPRPLPTPFVTPKPKPTIFPPEAASAGPQPLSTPRPIGPPLPPIGPAPLLSGSFFGPLPPTNLPVQRRPQEVYRTAGSFIQAFPSNNIPTAAPFIPPHFNAFPAAHTDPKLDGNRPQPLPIPSATQAPPLPTKAKSAEEVELEATQTLLERLAKAARAASARVGGTIAEDAAKYAEEAANSAIAAADKLGFPINDIEYLTKFALKTARQAVSESEKEAALRRQASLLTKPTTTTLPTTIATTTAKLTTRATTTTAATKAPKTTRRVSSKKALLIRQFRERQRLGKLGRRNRAAVRRNIVSEPVPAKVSSSINTGRFAFLAGLETTTEPVTAAAKIHRPLSEIATEVRKEELSPQRLALRQRLLDVLNSRPQPSGVVRSAGLDYDLWVP